MNQWQPWAQFILVIGILLVQIGRQWGVKDAVANELNKVRDRLHLLEGARQRLDGAILNVEKAISRNERDIQTLFVYKATRAYREEDSGKG